MKYNYIKDDFFYHVHAVLNNGKKFYGTFTKEEMVKYIVDNRKVPKTQFKNDTDLIKTYLAVIDRESVKEKPKQQKTITSESDYGKFIFLLLRNELWQAIENNIPKNKWEAFFESAIEKSLQRKGFYQKGKKNI